jgi:hypothetical protein
MVYLRQVPDFRKARGQRFVWSYLLALVAKAAAAGQTSLLTTTDWKSIPDNCLRLCSQLAPDSQRRQQAALGGAPRSASSRAPRTMPASGVLPRSPRSCPSRCRSRPSGPRHGGRRATHLDSNASAGQRGGRAYVLLCQQGRSRRRTPPLAARLTPPDRCAAARICWRLRATSACSNLDPPVGCPA